MPLLRRRSILYGALGVALAGAWPALSQNAPESLLPPGFGGPPSAPPPAAAPAPAPQAPAASATPAPAGPAPIAIAPPELTPEAIAAEAQADDGVYRLPPSVSRSIDVAGFMGANNGGYGADAFGRVDGRYLVGLMRRLDAPVPSRWMSIVLRRALATRVATPPRARAADWVAERAWLMLRMGDVAGAQLLIGGIGAGQYTNRLYDVAGQVALASGDIGLVCPMAEAGANARRDPFWQVARAMCAGLGGETSLAAALIDRARDRRLLGNIDLLLAERIASAGAGGRRSVNMDWSEADRLTIYRYGLATAAGIDIPDRLLDTAVPRVLAWRASAPLLDLEPRLAGARRAAVMGVASSADLVDLHAALADQTDSFAIADTPAGRLRAAYVADDVDDRIAAMKALWKADSAEQVYAGHIATARAAARIQPDAALADDAAGLIASMLAAGLDRQAARWWPVVSEMDSKAADPAWIRLALGAPGDAVPVSAGRLSDWAGRQPGGATSPRARLALAGLAGLGRLSPADTARLGQEFGAGLDLQNRYLARLDRAAGAGRRGEVALLAALGMQTAGWRGVPPAHFYRIVAALKQVGLEAEARMLAAEAVART